MSDPFDVFAVHRGLRLECQLLYAAPRDVLQPPNESDQYFLVTLSRPAAAASVRLVFATPLREPDAPTIRDVLWWLAGDAWALEHVGSALEPWAAHHGYPPADPATVRLFESHAQQAAALATLLGPVDCRRLLTLYEAQVSAQGSSTRER